MSIEVPIPEGDEARSLTQEELGQGHEYHCWFNHGSTCTTSVFPKDTKYVWFLDQAIWREEQKSEYDLKKPVEECEDKWMQRPCSHKSISNQEQLEAIKEEVKNAEVVIATLNGLPRSWDSFMRGICARRKWLISARAHTRRRSLTHDKRREDGGNWRSSSHHPKKIPQPMRNVKISTLE